MSVPSNLIPTRITQLPVAPVASEDSLLLIVYEGVSYQIRAGDLLAVAGVPVTRQVIAGTGMTGGGQLTSNVTLSVANNGIGPAQLAPTGVTPGTYGDATHIPVFTIDDDGRVEAAGTVPVVVSGYVPVSREVIAGTGLSGGGPLNANVTLSANFSSATPAANVNSGTPGVATSAARGDHAHPAVDLASGVATTGVLPVSRGGTGQSIVPAPGAIVYSGADGLYVGPVGVSGQVLVSDGTSGYVWGSALIVSDQPANTFYAGPTAGPDAPTTFRAMVNADLPNSAVTPGTYGAAASIPVITVDSKGIVTGVTTQAVAASWALVTGKPTTLAGYGITDGAHNGANSDITSMSGLTGGLSSPDFVQFDAAATVTPGVGRLFYDSGDGTLTVGLKGGNVELQIGQENVVLAYNNTAGTISNGQVVAVNGAQGQRPAVVLADADTEPLSAGTLGVATEGIAAGAEGFVATFGVVRGLNTAAFTPGDPIYLSQTAGAFTATRPAAPAHTVFLGWVIKAHASSGEIFLNISNGWELDELHNVLITSPTSGNTLIYDGAVGVWKNANLTDGAGIAITEGAGSITIANTGVTSFSGGTTGLTPSTGTTGAVTLGGTLALANGGTGATTASGARTALELGTAATLNAGVAGGVATLDGSGTVPTSQLPAAVLGALKYQGAWNAATNTPTLTSSVGTQGYYYVVSVPGATNLDGITDWQLGDWAIFNGSVWQKIDNTDAVSSVNGYTGAVVLSHADVGAPSTTGVGASGTWGIAITGNAGTATELQTARTINGTSFNGSGNIVTSYWGTARTFTIGSTGKSVDGSLAMSWSLADIGAPATDGTGATGTWNINISGNAATATSATSASAVANAATFNNSGAGAASGTTFDGSAARTISYNTVGAPSATGTGASGTWAINITGDANYATTAGNAATVTNGVYTTGSYANPAWITELAGSKITGQLTNGISGGTF